MNWQEEAFYLTGSENFKEFQDRVKTLEDINKDKEIERLNNIINELEKWLNDEIDRLYKIQNNGKIKPYGEEYNNYTFVIGAYTNAVDKIKELKENK